MMRPPPPRSSWMSAAGRPPAIAVGLMVLVIGEVTVALALHSGDHNSKRVAAATTTTNEFSAPTFEPVTTATVAPADTATSDTSGASSSTVTTVAHSTTTPHCTASPPSVSVTGVTVIDHPDGTDDYTVRVEGNLTNNSSKSVDVMSIDYAVLTGADEVGAGTATIQQTVPPGQSIGWSSQTSVHSPSGAPNAAQVRSVSATSAGC